MSGVDHWLHMSYVNDKITRKIPRIGIQLIGISYFLAEQTSPIATGAFSSVVVHQDQVYATDCEIHQTQVFLHDTSQSGWRQLKCINHDFGLGNDILTLSISNDQLKCCSARDGRIKVYSLSGELLRIHRTTTCGRGLSGKLNCPFIRDDDDDGSVLIVDGGRDRLQVISEQGEFSVVHLQPPVSQPSSAVLNKNLYVTSCTEKYIYKYSC